MSAGTYCIGRQIHCKTGTLFQSPPSFSANVASLSLSILIQVDNYVIYCDSELIDTTQKRLNSDDETLGTITDYCKKPGVLPLHL